MKTLLLASCAALLLTSARGAPVSENPPKPAVVLQDFKLIGELSHDQAVFTLTGTARVENPRGGSMEVLAGPVALAELGPHPKWRVRVEGDRYFLSFERGGKFPVQLKFNAAVHQDQNSKSVEFRVAPGVLQPILLRGLAADTQFDFAGAARPQRQGGDFVSYLPSDGVVKLSWKEAKPEIEFALKHEPMVDVVLAAMAEEATSNQ